MKRVDLHQRAAGVLLHPTSLPGPHGSGDLGPSAHRFAALLSGAGQRWWQLLPVGPVGYGHSPYSAHSAFAGNPLLISLEQLALEGLLPREAIARPPRFAKGRIDFGRVIPFREQALRRAFEHWRARPARARRALDRFAEANASWLDDYALFSALKQAQGLRAWVEWPAALRARRPAALKAARLALADEIDLHRFTQWLFDVQWCALQQQCHALGVGLLGDLPIFVAHDSADVWSHPELWQLDAAGQPTIVAGVPPDYFSATGQRWGNPHYRWDRMRRDGYAWWTARLRAALARFDAVRLDHFIGFVRAWEIPAAAATAQEGRWQQGPGAALFERVRAALGELPLVAEDLGAITPEVTALRERLGFPGLRILQFAFGADPGAPEFLPHRYPRRTVVYTGTHDNDTTAGWFRAPGGAGTPLKQAERERRAALLYLGGDGSDIHLAMVRAAMTSVADLCVVPMQDLLGLGSEARLNRPGVPEGNWGWRLAALPSAVTLRRHAELTRLTGRAPPPVRLRSTR